MGVQGKQNPHCWRGLMIPVNLGWESCAWVTGVWHFGVSDRVGAPQVHHHLYKGRTKDKGKLLFQKGVNYCGGKARWRLAHRWMSTPSLVEISPRIKSYGRFIFKKFEFFEICSGFVKNFLRYRFPKKIWPGNVLGETLFVFFSVRLRNEIGLTLTLRV